MKRLEEYVTTIPDFPEKGIMFRDITTVMSDPEGFRLAIDTLKGLIGDTEYDYIVGLESRGFMFGCPIAYSQGKGFIPIRKKGKLPRETVSREYALEYGTAAIEIHKDDIKPGDRIVLVDDLIATGGTVEAAVKLIEELGGKVVKIIFLLELAGLKGRERLKDYDVESALIYEGK